jgi:hypothetical protein
MAAAVAAMAILSGCSNTDMFSSQGTEQWFNKPFSGFTKQDWGTRTSTKDPIARRPATPEDFVDANGHCAVQAAAPATSQLTTETGAAQGGLEAAMIAGGITLTMTECEVVARGGTPSRVEISGNPAGERTAVLTYLQGPAPGVYRFVSGRLKVIDAVPVSEKPKPAPRKKSSAKPTTAPR